ncbi:hypothetical protein CWC11_21225, partial [Pseudoalteromonas sp. S3178]|uniref:hypothetical protein n=1 Tax=Pseudoalteromonas sp. S3178 TaxID=579532 RepID=UPI0012718B71
NKQVNILCKSLDFGDIEQAQILTCLFNELEDTLKETEIRFDKDGRFVRRITPTSSQLDEDSKLVTTTDDPINLLQTEAGQASSLEYSLI